MNLACFLGVALILVVPATAEQDGLLSSIEGKTLEKKFANGRSQILAAELTPECRDIALTNLEEAKTKVMTCDGAYEVIADIGSILDQAFDSTSGLSEYLNALLNGILRCTENHAWYNIMSIIFCIANEFKPTVTALTHINNFTNYYTGTLTKMKELIDCMEDNKSKSDASVKKIVDKASLCTKPSEPKRTEIL